METYEDEDDTHFCIKCHQTVNGLDNYVRHRQSGCRAPPETKHQETVNEPPMTPTTVIYPEILNADAFFSSLELQSSSKSNTTVARQRGSPPQPKQANGKRKRSRKVQMVKENLLPVVTAMDDLMDNLVIPSLVGFPEIVATTGSKSSTVVSGKTAKVNDENLGDSTVEPLITGSKGSDEAKRNAEWLGDGILGDLEATSENKDDTELTNYDEYEYEDSEPESTLDDRIQEDDRLQEDVESSDDDEDDDDDDEDAAEYPRHSHTGGKWKPSELLHQHQETSKVNDEEERDDDCQDNPVAHTGGKWKPLDGHHQAQRDIEDEAENLGNTSITPSNFSRRENPTAGLTRGKWIPGVTAGTEYWCDPCGRKLKSRLLYNRHLLSDLHARRSIQEIDGDSLFPRASILQRKSTTKRQKAIADNKSKRDNGNPEDKDEVKYDYEDEKEDKRKMKKKSRKREKEILWCEMCHARVRRLQMGKHLLSHYHCRVAGTNPGTSDNCSPATRRFILKNMSNIVHQCPFQCSSCRFYCNTEETFLLHWRSKLHAARFDQADNYKCSACNFYCEDNESMERHLEAPGHREIVAMINGSVPIVVRRQKSLACETCNHYFQYNLQLRFHARKTGHRVNSTASDEYQSIIACNLCSQVMRSLVALQRHQLSFHTRDEAAVNVEDKTKVAVQPAPYFCSFCNLNFPTARDAVLHRRTLRHKEMVRTEKLPAERIGSLERECRHCGIKHSSLSEHKEHLLEQHPELCHRCPHCGKLFALSQDVTTHSRGTECSKTIAENSKSPPKINDKVWGCKSCPFATDSQSEFIFHEALHSGCIDESEDEEPGNSGKPRAKYRCPMCEKSFPKGSLRNHIRNHTGERPFRCVKCSASFGRRAGLNAHRKECPADVASSSTLRKTIKYPRQRNHTCSECSMAFYTNHLTSRLVSYQEVYTTRKFLFKKLATRINYRWEYYREWKVQSSCCPGYEPQGIETSICHPNCPSGCHNGRCIEPNVCSCESGYRAVEIDGIGRCAVHCTDGCGDNGSCIAPNTCACKTGYSLTMSVVNGQITSSLPCIPKCISPVCGKNSYCQSPGTCACKDGYKVTELTVPGNFDCVPSCDSGCPEHSSCLFPEKCICYPGYSTSTDLGNLTCSPICHHPCVNAICAEPELCRCHEGFEFPDDSPFPTCVPVCEPKCPAINGVCVAPNKCSCEDGYELGFDNVTQLTICKPVCDSCGDNEICVAPKLCQCQSGYRQEFLETGNKTGCRPICQDDCFNATCTLPNYCECYDGYQKTLDSTQGMESYVNTCVPKCSGQCLNGTCVSPERCICDLGFVLVNLTSIASTSTTNYDDNTTMFDTQICQPESYSYEITVSSTDRVFGVEDCGANTDYLDTENGKCVCKYGWTGRICEKSLLCALLFTTSSENETTTSRSIFMVNDTIEPNNEDNDDRTRLVSRDDDAGTTIEWNGPMCVEQCRLMISSENTKHKNDETVNCYLLESENIMTGVLSIRERTSLTGNRNTSIVCFIDIESSCNLAGFQFVHKTYKSVVAGVVGGIIIIVLLAAVGLTVYYRKKRASKLTTAVALLIRPESMNSLHTTEESSSL